MSYDIQVRPRQENLPELADTDAPYAFDGAGGPEEGLFTKLHRLLRGRYLWAILLGTLLGTAGGFGGYFVRKPVWSSTGMIHIRPYQAPLVRDSEYSGPMTAYQSFRETQVAYLKQQRVIDIALQSAEWRALNRPGTLDEVWQDFLASLTAVAPPGSETVLVTFTDPDAVACTAAVKNIIRAYSSIYLENADREQEEKVRTLDSFRVAYTSERDAKREAIRAIAREFGTDDLRPIHQSRQDSLNHLESKLREIDAELAGQAALPGADVQKPNAVVRKLPKDMTAEDIALVNVEVRRMYEDYQDAEVRIGILRQNLGPNHPQVRGAQTLHDLGRQKLDRYVEQWRRAAIAAGAGTDVEIAANPAANERRKLETSRKQYLELVQNMQKETKDLGLKMLDIERLRQEELAKAASLAEIVQRIDTIRTESKAPGRVEIKSWGDRPVRVKDPRIQFAAAGGGGGLILGIGIVAMFGLFDRRMNSLADARTSARLPLLGILPELPQDLADPEQAATAAHCVHQIRTLLQIGQGGEERRVFTITSPAALTGKTSLTLSLGVSFAAADSRTLLIDCDVVGGGLTARVETIIRRKIGQILTREGRITQPQLETALRLAHNSQRKLGEILVELGYLTPEDVDRALTAQQDEAPVGMLDALAGEPIGDCVAETGIQGLFILPIGGAMPSDVSKLSPRSLRELVARAKEKFDIILIDTGPVPGSLEAAAAATAADGVILVVSRGEHRPLAEKALQYLQELGARLSGMVFNRARARDVDAATTATRLTSFDRTGRARKEGPLEAVDPRFGPVAGAVATSSPANKHGTRPQQS